MNIVIISFNIIVIINIMSIKIVLVIPLIPLTMIWFLQTIGCGKSLPLKIFEMHFDNNQSSLKLNI